MASESVSRRIHFVGDVTEHDDGTYECQRCGFDTEETDDLYEHRTGLLTECLWARIEQWVSRHV